MLISILINVKYLQDFIFSFEKGSNDQIHSGGRILPNPWWLFGKPWILQYLKKEAL